MLFIFCMQRGKTFSKGLPSYLLKKNLTEYTDQVLPNYCLLYTIALWPLLSLKLS